MGSIKVHEFISLDGVIDSPTWTFEYGFHPRMGESLGHLMRTCDTVLLGRKTYEMFEPAWSVWVRAASVRRWCRREQVVTGSLREL